MTKSIIYIFLWVCLYCVQPIMAQNNITLHLGADGGAAFILGDVRSTAGMGGGVNVQAHKDYLGLRFKHEVGSCTGLDYTPSRSYSANPAWNYYDPATDDVYYNYQTNYAETSLSLVVNVLGKWFYSHDGWFTPYVQAGIGAYSFRTSVDAIFALDSTYDFASVPQGDKQETLAYLNNDFFDGIYETGGDGQQANSRIRTLSTSAGVGMKFRINPLFVIHVEALMRWTGDPRLDGNQWAASTVPGNLVPNPKPDRQVFIGIGANYVFGGFTNFFKEEDNKNRKLER